jgi:hypothetical protein
MSKTKISEYSATANSNTDVGGINIDEGCAPSGINDAIRTLMAQLKNFQTGTGGDSFNGPIGTTTPAAGAFTTLSATGVATFSAGSASAPALTTSGDTNTGIAFPAADTVAVATGGTERVRVDSSGNVGVGVTPSAWRNTYNALQIGIGGALFGRTATQDQVNISANYYVNTSNADTYINNGYATLYKQNTGQHQWYYAANNSSGANASLGTFTQAMTLDASSRLIVGTTTAQGGLTTSCSIADQWASFCINTNQFGVGSYTRGGGNAAAYPIAVWAAYDGTQKASIDGSGNLLVGTTSAAGVGLTLSGGGTQIISNYSGDFTAASFRINGTQKGYITVASGGTTYSTSSDYRLKENVQPMIGALAKVAALNPVTYKWKEDGADGEGFIAHELAEVCPQAVVGAKDAVDEDGNPVYQGIDTSFLVATLTAAIQELKAEFDAYKATHP